jgi:hypothetical protein
MATKKTTKVAKKAVTKKAEKIVLRDLTLYVVSERGSFLGWNPVAAAETYADARFIAKSIDDASLISYKASKITAVKLVRDAQGV